MPEADPRPPLALDADTINFLEGPVSIVIAARGDDLVAPMVQAVGCRANADGTVSLCVNREQGIDVLAAIDAHHAIAVVFCQPSTVETLQLKSFDARWRPAAVLDHAVAKRYSAALGEDLVSIGFGGDYADAILGVTDDLVVIQFTPHEAYRQTPGPHAGAALECARRGAR
ncbi:MAG: hypothetical protein JST00_36905 [Deltaproteobacteria bacterium]|nr:hypothetical protein [Deltaproteobacteria bacterium]